MTPKVGMNCTVSYGTSLGVSLNSLGIVFRIMHIAQDGDVKFPFKRYVLVKITVGKQQSCTAT